MKNHTTMTDEQRAAHEAATIEGMHQQTAPQPPAAPVADVCGDDDAPDMEYTYNAPRLDLVPVRADELARLRAVNERLGQESVANLTLIAELRAQITDLHCDYSGQIATLELRVRELESERLSLNEAIAVADKLNAVQRVKELEGWIAAVPSGALIDYYYGSGALSYDAREARPVVGAWIRRLEDENAAAMRGEVRP